MKRSRSRSRIEVRYKLQRGKVTGFQLRGHSGFAPAGRDIVCAGVSALVLAVAHGLRKHAGARTRVLDSPDEYALALIRSDRRAQALLHTLISGLLAIARSYPAHLTVEQSPAASPGPRSRSAKAHLPRVRSTTE